MGRGSVPVQTPDPKTLYTEPRKDRNGTRYLGEACRLRQEASQHRIGNMSPHHLRPRRRAYEEHGSRLFRLRRRGHAIIELPTYTAANEKTLQHLMERHLDRLLGVRLLASECAIGRRCEGRIDTLGIDEGGAPVVIEYKRTRSANLISQGLFYLDWLNEHRAEFRLQVHDRIGPSAATAIKWGEPRLICVASDFHRYDLRAVRQIKRRIELVRYQWYGDDLLLLAKIAGYSA
jgi:hypothetical protein